MRCCLSCPRCNGAQTIIFHLQHESISCSAIWKPRASSPVTQTSLFPANVALADLESSSLLRPSQALAGNSDALELQCSLSSWAGEVMSGTGLALTPQTDAA